MSWSKKGVYKDVATAKAAVEGDNHLPAEVKSYITRGLDNWVDQTVAVQIDGHGHVCDGPGSYEPTTIQLTVSPVRFVTA